ncbi:hypothetical protein P43SY_001272 [Pythium insidiosum]|uniref:E3 ubiquitin-protein ligase n=1 Tax=Pythium insidiosum TaxID=114742 RepID=A0AAD5LXQ2_PYTIN|nr:hypothetical protein P43SY_001272 [Pythium insidiosum]
MAHDAEMPPRLAPLASARPTASDVAAKEARLLSQLLVLFSVARPRGFRGNDLSIDDDDDDDEDDDDGDGDGDATDTDDVVRTGVHVTRSASLAFTHSPPFAASTAGHSPPLGATVWRPREDGDELLLPPAPAPARTAATRRPHALTAAQQLRTRPSERELIQQFLLLPTASQHKVAQSLFVIPPSLIDSFSSVLQFFLRVIIEAHSDSRIDHHRPQPQPQPPASTDVDVDADAHADADADATSTSASTALGPDKSCSWASNGDVACVERVAVDADSAASASASSSASASTSVAFAWPAGFLACVVEAYGAAQRHKCEEVWHGDHMAYRCRTCGLSDSSCMCLACFDPADHEGHDFRVYRCSSGGCCDCGDPLAWRPDGFCKRHRHGQGQGHGQSHGAGLAAMGDLERRAVDTLVRRVVAFGVHVLREVHQFCLRPDGRHDRDRDRDRVLPRTGRRRAAFPAIVQVHLERLHQCLAWLQALATSCLAYRALVSAALFEELPPAFSLGPDGHSDRHSQGQGQDRRPRVALDVFLQAGVLLPVEICDTLGVLYLKLLFDQDFKQRYTCHFVDWYPHFIELYLLASAEGNDDGVRSLSRFIDRLFCQLFHSTAQLEELERAFQARAGASAVSCVETLMTFLLDKLLALFQSTQRVETVGAAGATVRVADCGRGVFRKRIYARLCSDLRTLLVHPRVAAQILHASLSASDAEKQWTLRAGSVFARLVDVVATLQAMDLQLRHVTQHIEFESQTWTFAFVVDYEMTLLLSAFAGGVPLVLDPLPPAKRAALAAALLRPIKRAIQAWTRSRWDASREDGDNSDSGAAPRKRSFHAPLQRMLAAFLQGVSSALPPRDWRRLLLLDDDEENEENDDEEDDFLWRMAMDPLSVALFAREIKSGLWVRNGNVMWQQLVHYLAKHWRYFGLHSDLFVCQLSAALLPRGQFLRRVLRQLPCRDALQPVATAAADTHASEQTEMLEESLRLVLQLLTAPVRWASCVAPEASAAWLLEREAMHWLSLGATSRSDVVLRLDLKLVEQIRQLPSHPWARLEDEEILTHVLESVGQYDDPSGSASHLLGFGLKMSGTWRLKDALWPQISPLFEGFNPSERQQCEQNIRKERGRAAAATGGAGALLLLPTPTAEWHSAMATTLAQQLVDAAPMVAALFILLSNWVETERRERATTSENLLVVALQLLHMGLGLLSPRDDEEAAAPPSLRLSAGATWEEIDMAFEAASSRDFFSKLSTDVLDDDPDDDEDESAGTTSSSSSVMALLADIVDRGGSSPDVHALARAVLDAAVTKSPVCRDAVSRCRRHNASDSAARTTPVAADQSAEQSAAKEAMRRRQQEIMARMRKQQQQFLSSHSLDADGGARTSDANAENEQGVALGGDADAADDDHDAERNGEEEEEEEEEDDEEDDEWGFPTGHIDLPLYLRHLSSAIAQRVEKERQQDASLRRRLRRRSRSRSQSRSQSQSQSRRRAPSATADGGASLAADDRPPLDDSEDEPQCGLCRLPCDAEDADMTFGYVGMILPTNLPTKLQLSPPSPFPAVPSGGDPARPAVCGDTIAWTCGHAVHHACIKAYLVSLWKQRSGGRHAVDAHGDDRLLSERDMEFLCPICRRLSNFVLPDVSGLLLSRPSPADAGPSLKAADAPDVCGFSQWLQRCMDASDPPRSKAAAPSSTALEAAVRTRVRKFGRHMKLRAVRTTLLLPMTLARDNVDDVAVDEEIRRRADAWSATVPHCTWLLRSLRVSIDVAQHERELLQASPRAPLDKQRAHSLRLLLDAATVAAMDDRAWDGAVERSSSVLFGRRVLFADEDDEEQEQNGEGEGASKPARDVPMLASQALDELFLTRMLWVQARALQHKDSADGHMEDAALSAENALADALYSSRLIVTAAILQAMGALCVSTWGHDSAASPATPSRRRPITDFHDVESLRDAMSWVHHLLSRTRFVSPDGGAGVGADREPPERPRRWDVSEIEERVVLHCLPLLRRVMLMMELCFSPRGAPHDGGGPEPQASAASESDPCAVCDEIFTATTPDDGQDQLAELQSYLRRLHLPPLRLFFRPHVFTAGQRELCQLWGAQIESHAAVLRRRRDRLPPTLQPRSRSLLPLAPVPSRCLIMPLPRVYMELFIKYNERPMGLCQRCRQLPQHPAICLFCGQVLCCFSPCCESVRGRIGECTQHTQACGLGTGAYLLLRACTVILFIGNERRCVWGSLYVDKNGEEDPYLRRGKTLYLAPHRLLALEALLVSHSFAQNTAILANTSRRDGRRY